MDRWSKGIITLSDEVAVSGGFTFDDLANTPYYCGQKPDRFISLANRFIIDEHEYLAGFFFRGCELYMLSLYCCDRELSLDQEHERKAMHDNILREYGLEPANSFDWGYIRSSFDPKGYVSSIDFCFNPAKAG